MARGQKHGRRCPCQRCDERWNSSGYYSADVPSGSGSQTFEKYRSSETRDTGTPQTDLQFGEKGGGRGGHIAVDDTGSTRYVRDSDGTELYDHLRGDEPDPSKGWS